jgi:hypothetical protein
MVFGEALFGITDRPNQFVLEIGLAVHKVQHLTGKWVLQEAVDCEIAALRIEGRIRLELNFLRMATIGVQAFAAKRSNFNVLATCPADEHHTEMRTYNLRVREARQKLLGRGIGTNVVILGRDTKKSVADTTPDEICRVMAAAQLLDYF